MPFSLTQPQLSAFKTALEAAAADPAKAGLIDQIHKIVHWLATSDPVADRALIDKYLRWIGIVAFFVPGLSVIVQSISGIVDAPGGIEMVVQLAQMLDSILPPIVP